MTKTITMLNKRDKKINFLSPGIFNKKLTRLMHLNDVDFAFQLYLKVALYV